MARPGGGYKLDDGRRVVGTTTILSRFKESGALLHWAWKQGRDGFDYRQTRDDAATAGTIAHEMCDAHIHGREWKPNGEPEELLKKAAKAFEAFVRWTKSVNLQVVATEVPMVSHLYAYGGTPDIIGICADELVVCDLKTANRIYPETLMQCAAYAQLWEENRGQRPVGAHVLRLGKESATFTHASWPADALDLGWRTFKRMLDLYSLDQEVKRLVG